jgi:hypothetical protein
MLCRWLWPERLRTRAPATPACLEHAGRAVGLSGRQTEMALQGKALVELFELDRALRPVRSASPRCASSAAWPPRRDRAGVA